jgi:hypothetical protein
MRSGVTSSGVRNEARLPYANTARAYSQGPGDLGGAIPLEVAQGQDGAIAFWQQAEKPLHAHLGLLASTFRALESLKLRLKITQRTRLVLTLRLPVVSNCRASRRVEPAACTFGTLILASASGAP